MPRKKTGEHTTRTRCEIYAGRRCGGYILLNSMRDGDRMKEGRTKCEVYSRVVGYLRPVDQWNAGKQAEFVERKTYVVE
jgi:anaerobic ribonucleoside-triphosphate reductase